VGGWRGGSTFAASLLVSLIGCGSVSTLKMSPLANVLASPPSLPPPPLPRPSPPPHHPFLHPENLRVGGTRGNCGGRRGVWGIGARGVLRKGRPLSFCPGDPAVSALGATGCFIIIIIVTIIVVIRILSRGFGSECLLGSIFVFILICSEVQQWLRLLCFHYYYSIIILSRVSGSEFDCFSFCSPGGLAGSVLPPPISST
jgi:hypothetical protein